MAPFCSCPASLVSRKFFAVGPGCAKCFFFCCAPLGAATFRRGQSRKKNTTQGVFFFAPAPGRRSPVGRRHGARAKKKTPPRVFFFCSGPGERQGKEKPRWKPAWGQSKKKNTTQGVFFFLLWPRAGAQRGFSFPCRSRGRSKKTPWVVFFFCSGPVPAPNGFSFPCLSPGPQQKKNTLVVFFFCSGPVPAPNGASPSRAFRRGRSKKKNTLGGVSFFAAAPRGRSLTHCGPGWRCLPLGGVVFFFLLRPPPDRGGVFFFAVAPPGRSLTHGGLGRFRQGPGGVFFFFLLRPRRVFLDNNKKCLGYYIGSKKTRRGHSKTKNTTSILYCMCK